MHRIDENVARETRYILTGIFFFSAVMQLIFLLLSAFEAFGYRYSAVTLLSCLFTDTVMLADFFLMALSVQKALNTEDAARAQLKLKSSSSIRSVLKLVILGAAVYLVLWVFTEKSIPNLVALLLPVFFPRITITFRSILLKKRQSK